MSLLSIVILTGNALVLSAYVAAIDWKGLYNEFNIDTIDENEYKQKFKDVMERYKTNFEYFRSVDVDGTLKCIIDKLKDEKYPMFFKTKHRKHMYPLIQNAERIMNTYLK